MRYIADASGYVKEVSFGAMIVCGGVGCKEYTGTVPSGYSSLIDWFTQECEKLYRWRIVGGNLTLDSSASNPPEKEWTNPPMAQGEEYRTTERWAGEPVYRYMVNIGALPNSSFAEIAHGLSVTHIVRCEGVSNYGFALPMAGGANRVDLGCDRANIYVTTTADYSYSQAYITIYYTKT